MSAASVPNTMAKGQRPATLPTTPTVATITASDANASLPIDVPDLYPYGRDACWHVVDTHPHFPYPSASAALPVNVL